MALSYGADSVAASLEESTFPTNIRSSRVEKVADWNAFIKLG